MAARNPPLRIGTAGWAIPRAVAGSFAESGSGLTRYAGRFAAAEINSSFHRSHRPAIYERWAGATPDGFRFSAKLPKTITHQLRLVGAEAELVRFIGEASALSPKLGALLVQLPPSLVYDDAIARGFFAAMRSHWTGPVACEPRHATWFGDEAGRCLREFAVALVEADPSRVPDGATPQGWPGLRYIRLHGSPRMYYSPYPDDYLADLAARLAAAEVETWCIFDNTASGAASANALNLLDAVAGRVATS